MSNGYARDLLRIVIAQICQNMDCEGIEQSACETMVDILQHYMEELGYLSHSFAEHAGRIEANYNDVQLGLKEMKVSMREMMLFHSQLEDMPFARAIPRFPLGQAQKKRRVLTSPDALPPHIPLHFPPFPDKSTWMNTSLYIERERDRKKLRIRKNKEREHLEYNLKNLLTDPGNNIQSDIQTTGPLVLEPPKNKESKKSNTSLYVENFANYEASTEVVSSDYATVQSSQDIDIEPNLPKPTPITADSPFLSALYNPPRPAELPPAVAPPPPVPNPTTTDVDPAQKEKEKQHHVDLILSLTHEKNSIDPIVHEPPAGALSSTIPPPTTTTAPASTPSTPAPPPPSPLPGYPYSNPLVNPMAYGLSANMPAPHLYGYSMTGSEVGMGYGIGGYGMGVNRGQIMVPVPPTQNTIPQTQPPQTQPLQSQPPQTQPLPQPLTNPPPPANLQN